MAVLFLLGKGVLYHIKILFIFYIQKKCVMRALLLSLQKNLNILGLKTSSPDSFRKQITNQDCYM